MGGENKKKNLGLGDEIFSFLFFQSWLSVIVTDNAFSLF